jgi:hypothetical protein
MNQDAIIAAFYLENTSRRSISGEVVRGIADQVGAISQTLKSGPFIGSLENLADLIARQINVAPSIRSTAIAASVLSFVGALSGESREGQTIDRAGDRGTDLYTLRLSGEVSLDIAARDRYKRNDNDVAPLLGDDLDLVDGYDHAISWKISL